MAKNKIQDLFELDYWRGRIEYFYLTKSNLDILLEFISKIVFKLQ